MKTRRGNNPAANLHFLGSVCDNGLTFGGNVDVLRAYTL